MFNRQSTFHPSPLKGFGGQVAKASDFADATPDTSADKLEIGNYFFLPFALLFLAFLMLFFIPDLHPHELHIFVSFQT